jgi:hypothetical protein
MYRITLRRSGSKTCIKCVQRALQQYPRNGQHEMSIWREKQNVRFYFQCRVSQKDEPENCSLHCKNLKEHDYERRKMAKT